MSKKFKKPAAPAYRAGKQLASGEQPASQEAQLQKSVEQIYEKYEAQKTSRLIGLSDATGSMSGIWDGTRKHITEMIKRISELGKFEIRWIAYRDYTEHNGLIEASAWQNEAAPLLSFINSIQCYGGGDREEAVERALEFAASDEKASRVILIGDAPPHFNIDYREQAERLAQQQRPVFSFVVGADADTIRTFKEISDITGGQSMRLTKTEDLLDVIVLTVADDIGGEESVREYIQKWSPQLSEGGRQYARLLLGAGAKSA